MVEEINIPKDTMKKSLRDIPSDWSFKTIGNDIDLLTGYPFPSSKYVESGIRLLRGSNVKRGVVDWSEDITQFWERITTDLMPYLLDEGDIVIAMDGSLVGKSFARLSNNDVPALLLQRVARIRSNKVDLGYLKEYICSEYFTKHCESVKTVSAIPHISPKDIRSFSIPIPPTKQEQTAIATALSDTDALIESLEKLIKKKWNIKQGVMQKLLQPKTGWSSEPIKNLASITTGSKNTQDKVDNGRYPFFVRSPNIERINSYVFEGEAILIAGDGVGTGKVMHYFNGKFDFHQRVYKLSDFNHINGLYFFLYFKNNFYNRIMQMTAKSSVDSIRRDMISEMIINFPSVAVQNRIAAILSDMDVEIESLQLKLNKYRMIKQGMMQVLLTGKIRLV